jgi:hypothetical protein
MVEGSPGCELQYAGRGDADPRTYRGRLPQPRTDVRGVALAGLRGARELADTCCELGLTLEEFERDRFVRSRPLRRLLTSCELDADLRPTPRPA